MLYKFQKGQEQEQVQVEKVPFHNINKVKGKEKDLENLLANHLQDFFSDPVLMPISQERNWQEEPDLMALDENGTLYIFELKVGNVSDETVLQIIRYAQNFGVESYAKLDYFYQQWCCNTTDTPHTDLKTAHKDAFQLDAALPESQFNCKQKLILVGNTADSKLVQTVQYWQEKGVDIDFMPYRFYEIGGEMYFEFFAKPFDMCSAQSKKGVLFDTNGTHSGLQSVLDMLRGKKKKISAYGKANRFVDWLKKDDYVLYYQVGYGVIAAGIVTDNVAENLDGEERCRRVRLLTDAIQCEEDICAISPRELKELLGHGFFYANTIKRPYLSEEEAKLVIEKLKDKYEKYQEKRKEKECDLKN